MTTNPTQLSRPSRSRIMRARVGAWCDAHPVAMLATVGAITVALLSALAVFALVTDGNTLSNAIGAVGVSLCATFVAVLYAVMATNVYTQDKSARNHTRAFSRVIREHDAQIAQAIGTRNTRDMSAYEMSAELARIRTREENLCDALRVKVLA